MRGVGVHPREASHGGSTGAGHYNGIYDDKQITSRTLAVTSENKTIDTIRPYYRGGGGILTNATYYHFTY